MPPQPLPLQPRAPSPHAAQFGSLAAGVPGVPLRTAALHHRAGVRPGVVPLHPNLPGARPEALLAMQGVVTAGGAVPVAPHPAPIAPPPLRASQSANDATICVMTGEEGAATSSVHLVDRSFLEDTWRPDGVFCVWSSSSLSQGIPYGQRGDQGR